MSCIISQFFFDKDLYMFQTDLLSIIRSLNTVCTAIGICHVEILKMGKITNEYINLFTHKHSCLTGFLVLQHPW